MWDMATDLCVCLNTVAEEILFPFHIIGRKRPEGIQQETIQQLRENVLCRLCLCPIYPFHLSYVFLFLRLSEVDHFQKVLEHEAFKEDPLSAITQHVTNAVAKHVL